MKKIDSPFNGIFNGKLEQKDKLKAEKEKAREEERQLRIQKTIEKEKHEKRKEEKRKFLADLKDIILNAVSKFKVNFPDIQKIKGDVSINNFPDLKEKFDALINSVKGIKLEEKAQKDYSLSLDKILAEIKKENPDLKIIATLLESFKKIPLLDKFRFDDLGRLKVNVDKVGGGGGGSSSELVKNSAGVYINPSTEEKQDNIISNQESVLDLMTSSDLEGIGDITVGLTQVAITITGTPKTIRIRAGLLNTGIIYIGKTGVLSNGSNDFVRLESGDEIIMTYNDTTNALYAISDTAGQTINVGVLL